MIEQTVALDAPEFADDYQPDEEDLPFDGPERKPVALLSVTRALTRNWQELDDARFDQSDDDHYLSARKTAPPQFVEPEFDPELFAEIWQVMTERTQSRLRALGEAYQQLAAEIALLARSE
jgi:hypothetical protein